MNIIALIKLEPSRQFSQESYHEAITTNMSSWAHKIITKQYGKNFYLTTATVN